MVPTRDSSRDRKWFFWMPLILMLILLGFATLLPNMLSQSTQAQEINLALDQPAVASTFENTSACSNCTADKAFDGSTTTRWGSKLKSEPEWIYVDLGSAVNFDRVVLRWETGYGREYELQFSVDAVNWTTIFSETNGDGAIDDIAGLSSNGRYVRMYGNKRGVKRWGFSLWEFEIYGNSDPTATPVTPTATPDGPTPTPTSTPSGTPLYRDLNAPVPDRVSEPQVVMIRAIRRSVKLSCAPFISPLYRRDQPGRGVHHAILQQLEWSKTAWA